MTRAYQTSENIKVGINLNLKKSKSPGTPFETKLF